MATEEPRTGPMAIFPPTAPELQEQVIRLSQDSSAQEKNLGQWTCRPPRKRGLSKLPDPPEAAGLFLRRSQVRVPSAYESDRRVRCFSYNPLFLLTRREVLLLGRICAPRRWDVPPGREESNADAAGFLDIRFSILTCFAVLAHRVTARRRPDARPSSIGLRVRHRSFIMM